MSTLLSAEPASRLRFGIFEIDPVAEELSRAGRRVRIQGQPFRILLYLARRPGQMVTREELHRTFWKADTTVDLDRSLAAAIHKIRESLDDSVTSPRFIETVSRSGYRFIAPIAEVTPLAAETASQPVSALESSARPPHLPDSATPAAASRAAAVPLWRRANPAALLWAVPVVLLTVGMILWLRPPSGIAGVPSVRPITHNASALLSDPMLEGFPGAVTDNSRIYFSRLDNGQNTLAVVIAKGGESTKVTLPAELGSPIADDVSPDGLRLLLRDRFASASEQALWVASPGGQTARQVPAVFAHDSAWMPDGDTILFANGDALFTVHDNGSDKALFASFPGRPFRMRWSPDGKRLRLTLRDDRTLATTLWETAADGTGAHQILAGWHEGVSVCCGTFARAGELFVFQAGTESNGSLWALPGGRNWLGREAEPVRLAEGPLSYSAPTATHGGRGLVFTGFAPSFRLLSWSAAAGRMLPAPEFLKGAAQVAYAPTPLFVSWVQRDDGSLWRSRADGNDRVRVLAAPYETSRMAWSPDGTRMAVMARRQGAAWRVLVTDVASGRTEELLPGDPHDQADPQWMDNAKIVFGRLSKQEAEPALPSALYAVDLTTRQVTELPGSAGLIHPVVSPDGHTLIALDASQTTLRRLNLETGAWSTVAQGRFESPVFLESGRAVLYRDPSLAGTAFFRLDLATHQTSPFAQHMLEELELHQAKFAGLLPGDAPLISLSRDGADLYELDLPE